MYRIFCACVLVCTIACDSSSSSSSKGPVTGAVPTAGAPAAGAAPTASGTCKPVDICASFPIARVEKLCGGGIAKTQPTNVVSDAYVHDACAYKAANGGSVALISRFCVPASGGGPPAAQMFQMTRAEKGKRDVDSDASGIGDKAYYLVQDTVMRLFVLKGNLNLEVQSGRGTPETEAAIKEQCLLPIAKELLAL